MVLMFLRKVSRGLICTSVKKEKRVGGVELMSDLHYLLSWNFLSLQKEISCLVVKQMRHIHDRRLSEADNSPTKGLIKLCSMDDWKQNYCVFSSALGGTASKPEAQQ